MNQTPSPPPSSDNNKNKKPITSKRFISQKLEEMLQNHPDNDISTQKLVDYNNGDISLEKPTKDKDLPFFLQYPFLILFGILISVGWTIFFIQHYQKKSLLSVTIQVEKFAEWQHNAPIIASPVISDIDGDEKYDIGFADSLGYLWAVNPRTKETIYQTFLGGPVIASLAVVEVDGKSPLEVFTTTEAGKFFTINRQGGYLYSSREEYFREQIYSKPLVLSKAGVFYLAGMQGRIWGVGADYGEVLWMNDNSVLALEREGIFSSPILFPVDSLSGSGESVSESISQYLTDKTITSLSENLALVIAGERGTVATFNLSSGGLIWQQKINDSFKATPLVIKENGESYLLLSGTTGGIWILNQAGEIVDQVKLNETFISSPVTGNFISQNNERQTLLTSESGNVFLATLTDNVLRVEQIFSGNEGFIASPLAVNWNQDGHDDIMTVSREGGLFLWTIDPDILPGTTNRVRELTPPYRLGYKVTATPVIGDLNDDGQMEVVIGGENGKLSILTIRTATPLFSPGEIPSPYFLKNFVHDR